MEVADTIQEKVKEAKVEEKDRKEDVSRVEEGTKGKGKGKGPKTGCFGCGGAHYQNECPKGKGKAGSMTLGYENQEAGTLSGV